VEAVAEPRPRGRWRYALEERRFLAPVLIGPAVLFIALLVGAPLGLAIYLSLTDATAGALTGEFVGLGNYLDAWDSPNFRRALRNTIFFTLVSQAIVLVCAAILAHYLVRPFRGRWFLRFLILLPWAAPVSLGTIGWLWIFEPTLSVVKWTLVHLQTGPLDALGLDLIDPLDPPEFLGRPNLAMASLIAVHAWRILPFATVIFIAGLASIPAEVDDAAKVDGATGLKKLFYVTLPLQLPIALVALLFGIVFTATDIAVVYILTNGGPFNQTQMLTMWAFQTGIRGSALGQGAAISLYLLPILVFVSIGMLWFARRAEVT
jgi:multiple sugar transport system permease protein